MHLHAYVYCAKPFTIMGHAWCDMYQDLDDDISEEHYVKVFHPKIENVIHYERWLAYINKEIVAEFEIGNLP